jgi:uncharacterized protein (TIGR02147 family)
MSLLFDSLDYRTYLKESFDEIRKKKPWFSYRLIAQKLKIDAGQLVKILQAQRHISERLIPSFGTFLGLNKRELEYFTCLIRFNKAKSSSDTKLYFEKLMELKDLTLPTVNPSQDRFYQKWYYSVIRVLLAFCDFDGDYQKLGNQLSPPISAKEAQDAVQLLLDLGLIEKSDDGKFKVIDRFVTGGGSWKMLTVRHFQQQTIQLSERSLISDPPDVRDISSLTISIPQEDISSFRDLIAEFRKNILRRVMEDERPSDSVYQLNIQLIPVAKVKKSSEKAAQIESDQKV